MKKLKPHKVDVIEVARTQVPLFLDRERLDFFAMLGLEEVRDPTVEGLRKLVAIKLKNWRPETWEEFIAVKSSEPHSDGRNQIGSFITRHIEITFEFFRGERAKKLDGNLVERMHRLDRQEKISSCHSRDRKLVEDSLVKQTYRHWVPDGFVVLPYSDAAWAKLCDAEQQLREVREKIFKTVQSKQFLKALTGNNALGLLLPRSRG